MHSTTIGRGGHCSKSGRTFHLWAASAANRAHAPSTKTAIPKFVTWPRLPSIHAEHTPLSREYPGTQSWVMEEGGTTGAEFNKG